MDNNIKKMIEEIRSELERLHLEWDETSSDVLGEIYFIPYIRIDSKCRHGKQFLDFAITLNLLRREYHATKPYIKWEFVPDEN